MVTKHLGSFKRVDHSEMSFLRVRIAIDITKLSVQAFTLQCEEGIAYPITVRYERLGNICYYYSKIDHEVRECLVKFEDVRKNLPVDEIQRANEL